jgi:hypothetical protein
MQAMKIENAVRIEPMASVARRKPARFAMRAALLGLMLLGATAAHAADLCFIDTIGSTLIFKRFHAPRAGDCEPLAGFQDRSSAALSGVVCGTTDGQDLVFRFEFMRDARTLGPYGFSYLRQAVSPSVPPVASGGAACDVNTNGGAWTCSQFFVERIKCPAVPVLLR